MLTAKRIKNYDVFISYRHKSGYYMSHIIYTKLCASGYTVFMDKMMDSCKYEEKIRSAYGGRALHGG
jgi:hypothetical protein